MSKQSWSNLRQYSRICMEGLSSHKSCISVGLQHSYTQIMPLQENKKCQIKRMLLSIVGPFAITLLCTVVICAVHTVPFPYYSHIKIFWPQISLWISILHTRRLVGTWCYESLFKTWWHNSNSIFPEHGKEAENPCVHLNKGSKSKTFLFSAKNWIQVKLI